MREVTDETFENEVILSPIPVVVDFWASWCAPCLALMPLLEDLEEKEGNRIKFVKMNVDLNVSTPTEYGIRTRQQLPTLLLFKDGALIDTSIGAKSKSQLASFINV